MPIDFSEWHKWSNRATIPDVRKPGGVYIIGKRFTAGAVPDPLSGNVIYIGVTTQSVLRRLNGFDAACRLGRGNAGGNNFFDEFMRDEPDPDEAWRRFQRDWRIRVSVGRLRGQAATPPLNLLEKGKLKLAEVSLQVDFVRQNRRLPKLNRTFG